MNKYFLVAKNTWDQTFVYRVNFIVWRARTVLQLLTTYFLWFSVIPQSGQFFAYTRQTMLTYIIATSLIGSIVFSSLVGQVGDEINNGDLSNYLIRPINYFFYWFARDIGDKVMNVIFSVIEIIIITFILRPPLYFQTNPAFIFFSLIAIGEAVFIHFFINFLLGCIGFWSSEIWAPRFIFFTVYSFFSGGFFPLDILPKPVYIFFTFLPLPYLQYFPIKIYLGQVSITQILAGLIISLSWIFILRFFATYIWRKGLLVYTAEGR